MVRRNGLAAAAAILVGLAAAGCGGEDGDGGSTSAGDQRQVKNAKVIDLASMDGAKGRVT